MMIQKLLPFSALVVVISISSAARAQETMPYTVQAGDACDTIAKRLYGDASRYEEIHRLNPSLGPTPHRLVPGTVLMVPKPSPDARIAFARNQVQVQAGETHPGKPNDPLFRGNRVSTGDTSSAGVTFRDQSKLVLSDNTLVIIYGDTSQASATQSTTLVSGNLRANLSAFAGKKPVVVEAAGSSVAMRDGEVQVSVDTKKATRLAVYKGESSLSAQNQTIKVPGGFGSKAETGKSPTPPRPLPPAPVWISAPGATVIGEGSAEIAGAYGPGTGPGPAAAQWHVQVARDAELHDLALDVKVPVATTRFEAKNLPAGQYWMQVSAIDADFFEGPWMEVTTSFAVVAQLTPAGRDRRVTFTPADSFCSIDGGPFAQSGAAIPGTGPHRVKCARGADGAGAVESVIAATGRVVAMASSTITANGELSFAIHDAGDAPVTSNDVVLTGNGVFGPVRSGRAPGEYVATATWPAGTTQLTVQAVVEGEASPTVSVAVPEAPPAPAAVVKNTFAELGAGGLASAVGHDLDETAAGAAVQFAVGTKAGPFDLAIGGQGKIETVAGTRLWSAEMPVRVFLPRGIIAPYLAVAPLILHDSRGTANLRGGLVTSIGLRIGPPLVALYIEPGYRIMPVDDPDLPASGVQLAAGLVSRF